MHFYQNVTVKLTYLSKRKILGEKKDKDLSTSDTYNPYFLFHSAKSCMLERNNLRSSHATLKSKEGKKNKEEDQAASPIAKSLIAIRRRWRHGKLRSSLEEFSSGNNNSRGNGRGSPRKLRDSK